MVETCVFSPCRKWRYTLWRRWTSQATWAFEKATDQFGTPREFLQIIGLNPSTADESVDDNTIRRCIQYAKDWGFGAFVMTNLFAWRDTLPKEMMKASEPIGIDNDKWLAEIAEAAPMILCAWGNEGQFMNRSKKVLSILPAEKLYCLGVNASCGEPKHPLYLSGALRPIRLDEAKKML